jgi:hypothetical protein
MRGPEFSVALEFFGGTYFAAGVSSVVNPAVTGGHALVLNHVVAGTLDGSDVLMLLTLLLRRPCIMMLQHDFLAVASSSLTNE